jgi:DNA-binding NarL/FixJ family response regulator
MTLKDPVPSGANASDITFSPIDKICLRRLLIVIHPRELLRGCLSYWLRTLSQDFEVMSAPEVKKLIPPDTLARASVVVIGENSPVWPDAWLYDQIAFLRATRPTVPIVVICEGDIAEKYAAMNLQGYIPTSSSVEVAAAAINLVTVGGCYIPYAWDKAPQSKPLLPERLANEPQSAPAALLTPREEAVLDLIQRGMPNKIIAHNLLISESTVKAHVHNIIAKLDVHNRTEAAVAGHHVLPQKPNMDCAMRQSSKCQRQASDVSLSDADLPRRVNGPEHIPPLPMQSCTKSSRSRINGKRLSAQRPSRL